MATVLDAMCIQVNLDPASFNKGRKQVESDLDKMKDKAASSGKAVEASAKGMTESLSKTAGAFLQLAAIFTGGKGFKDFIEGSIKANTSLSQFNASLGLSPELAGAWDIAAKRVGGSAASAQASIKSMSDMLVDFRTQGKALPNKLFLLQAQSGKTIDFTHGVERLMVTAAAAAKELAKTDPAAANRFLSAIGADPATAALMIRQGANIKAYVAEQTKLVPSKADQDAAKQMTDAQGKLAASYDLLAAKVMTALAPALTWLADKLEKAIEYIAKWIEQHPKWAATITAIIALLTGAAAIAAVASIVSLTAAFAALAGLSFGPLLAVLGALGLTGAGIGVAAALGAFDDAKAAEGGGGKGGNHGTGIVGMRRRARERAQGAGNAHDIPSGRAGHLTDNQREAYRSAREEGLSDKAARALVANMSGEGLSVPHNVHWDGSHYAHGIVQWDDSRSADIKAHFGKMPQDMTVAEQTKAAIWEIRNRQRYARTKSALEGDNSGKMIDALVRNYESPRDTEGAIAKRSKIYSGLGNLGSKAAPSIIMKGNPRIRSDEVGAGARHSAALNSISNSYQASTTSSSNEAHINGGVHIHTQATDANGIASSIDKALKNNLFAQNANYGPA